jgi:hypothetical protein
MNPHQMIKSILLTLWSPQEGIWNEKLTKAIDALSPFLLLKKILIRILIYCDTFILFVRVFLRRISAIGLLRIFESAKLNSDFTIIYLDLGTHKEAKELEWMVLNILPSICLKFNAYGFEASKESFDVANQKFLAMNNVSIIHSAVVKELPIDKKIKLYKNSSGIGDSIYRESNSYEEVEAIRLSAWLKQNISFNEKNIILIRMNIEGAEYDVLMDLVEKNMAQFISGYYGMWNDVSKINPQKDILFRSFLKENSIYNLTFNGRDFHFFRLKCIEYDINTQVILQHKKLVDCQA